MIAEALEKLFNVKVKSVHIIVRKGKNRRTGRIRFVSSLTKKAIVTLVEGHSIDALEQLGGSMPSEMPVSASKE